MMGNQNFYRLDFYIWLTVTEKHGHLMETTSDIGKALNVLATAKQALNAIKISTKAAHTC